MKVKSSTYSVVPRGMCRYPHRHTVIVFLCVYITAAVASAQNTLHDTTYRVQEYRPGLFIHIGRHEEMSVANQGDTGNAGFIVGTQAVAVIDPGGSVAAAQSLRAIIRKTTPLPIKYLILTHFHPDHVAGASVFSEASVTIAHHNYRRAVAQRSTFYIERFASLMETATLADFGEPDVFVQDRLVIDLGQRELVLVARPVAHTDNDLTVFDVSADTIWASDLLFVDRMPSLDGSLTGWLKVLDSLSAENAKYVVPGHGQPSEWKKAERAQRLYLESLETAVRTAIADGKTLSQVLAPGAIGVVGQWHLHEAQHFTNITKAYTELEWE